LVASKTDDGEQRANGAADVEDDEEAVGVQAADDRAGEATAFFGSPRRRRFSSMKFREAVW
jgi:hypothetical protein